MQGLVSESRLEKFRRATGQRLHQLAKNIDLRFVADSDTPKPVPQPKMRLGVAAEIDRDAEQPLDLRPLVDVNLDVQLPNLEDSLKVFLTSTDQAALPGDAIPDAERGLSFGLRSLFSKNWNASSGLKIRSKPLVFAHLDWQKTSVRSNDWQSYPRMRFLWDNEEHFGVLSSTVLNRHSEGHVWRTGASVKWTEQLRDEDALQARDPDWLGTPGDGRGWRWQLMGLYGRALYLLPDTSQTRLMGGADIASGQGLSLTVSGDSIALREYRLNFLWKRPLKQRYLYYFVSPQLSQADENNFKSVYRLRIGLEMLIGYR